MLENNSDLIKDQAMHLTQLNAVGCSVPAWPLGKHISFQCGGGWVNLKLMTYTISLSKIKAVLITKHPFVLFLKKKVLYRFWQRFLSSIYLLLLSEKVQTIPSHCNKYCYTVILVTIAQSIDRFVNIYMYSLWICNEYCWLILYFPVTTLFFYMNPKLWKKIQLNPQKSTQSSAPKLEQSKAV